MRITVLGLTAALAIVLSGCASDTGSSGLSLADTKSSAQLMRNTISGQISPDITVAVRDVTDRSETCENDPDSLMRLWRSESVIEITPEASGKTDLIIETISGSFVAKGWESESTTVDGTSKRVTLTNPGSLAVIEITAKPADEFTEKGAIFSINIAGPCVKTDGPGSAELKQLGE